MCKIIAGNKDDWNICDQGHIGHKNHPGAVWYGDAFRIPLWFCPLCLSVCYGKKRNFFLKTQTLFFGGPVAVPLDLSNV